MTMNEMKFGVSAFAWTANFESRHLELLPTVREMGFAAFEIPMFKPKALPVAALRKTFAANDLDCTVCAILPEGINPISAEAGTRRQSQAHLVECIETAAEMGARLVGGPLFAPIGYLPPHRPIAAETQWAVEAFQSLGEVLDRYEMTLSLEPVNRSETFFLRTAAEAKELCDAIDHPRIGVTIDTFHANIEEKNIAEAIASLGARLKHLHASENDRSLLGTGHVDFPEIVRTLQRTAYDGYVMLEGFGFSHDEPDAPGALWADVRVAPEVLARQGLDYLRLCCIDSG